jgi:excisionase family DNA binding protein
MQQQSPPATRTAAALSSTPPFSAPQQPLAARMALSIPESCKLSGIGRSKLYQAIQTGALRARKLGKKTLILPEDLQQWLVDLPSYEPKRPQIAAE